VCQGREFINASSVLSCLSSTCDIANLSVITDGCFILITNGTGVEGTTLV